MWQLIINGPGYFDTAYDLPEGVTSLGRADENDIVLSGDLVSRKHARIRVSGDALQLEDLASRNGTRVNGQPLQGSRALVPGDTVTVGENTLGIRQPATVESAQTEMVDLGAGGVKRFGQGSDIRSAVILSKNVRDSVVLRMLDNFAPFDASGAPFVQDGPFSPAAPTDEQERDRPGSRIAFDSLVLLYKITEKLSNAATLQSFLEETADRVMDRVKATTAVVLLRHHSGVMVPATVRHRGKLEQGEVPVSDAVVEAALAKGAALAVADVREDQRFAQRESVIMYGVDQVLCVPVGQREPFAGVLYLNLSGASGEQIEPLLDLCTAVAHLIGTGIEKFQLKERAPGEERLRKTLERFHAPNIVERRMTELGRGTAQLTAMEEKQVTVLFADLAGFTVLARKLPPARVVEVLNEFYQRMTGVIFSFEGTVDKFIGDSVMALFGAPYATGDESLRAVRTALALKTEWRKAIARRPSSEQCDLKIGLNTGSVLAGTIGSEARLDYTAVGEVVNVASWLTASAKPGQILITKTVLAAIGARFDVQALGERTLNGSKQKLSAFEVIDEDVGHLTNPGSQDAAPAKGD